MAGVQNSLTELTATTGQVFMSICGWGDMNILPTPPSITLHRCRHIVIVGASSTKKNRYETAL